MTAPSMHILTTFTECSSIYCGVCQVDSVYDECVMSLDLGSYGCRVTKNVYLVHLVLKWSFNEFLLYWTVINGQPIISFQRQNQISACSVSRLRVTGILCLCSWLLWCAVFFLYRKLLITLICIFSSICALMLFKRGLFSGIYKTDSLTHFNCWSLFSCWSSNICSLNALPDFLVRLTFAANRGVLWQSLISRETVLIFSLESVVDEKFRYCSTILFASCVNIVIPVTRYDHKHVTSCLNF